jgi:cytochrome c biogenesis protein CcdA
MKQVLLLHTGIVIVFVVALLAFTFVASFIPPSVQTYAVSVFGFAAAVLAAHFLVELFGNLAKLIRHA